LSALVPEMRAEVVGRSVAKISLLESDLIIDLRLADGRLLLASINPSSPAFYMSSRDIKHEKLDLRASHPFVALLRKRLAGAKLISISKADADRVVALEFERFDAAGDRARAKIIASLTGRSANAYLTDGDMNIEAMLYGRGGYEVGDRFDWPQSQASREEMLDRLDESMSREEIMNQFFGPASVFGPVIEREFIARCKEAAPATAFASLLGDLFKRRPRPLVYSRVALEEAGARPMNLKSDLILSHIELASARELMRFEFDSLSEAADQYYRARDRAKAFQDRYGGVKRFLADEIKKRESLSKAIETDRERFAEPEQLKQWGDLLLANLATARVSGASVRVIDYYDPELREIDIAIGENKTLEEAARDYFDRYQKGRRALAAIESRKGRIAAELDSLRDLSNLLESDPTVGRAEEVRRKAESLLGRQAGQSPRGSSKQQDKKRAIGRWFISTDGYEIGVGKNDRDNDALSFRVARPQDIWMHAADYPGSHVIIRNPTRAEVPHRAIKEAAEIAAFYSQAKREARVAIHYTEKKFVSKPPRSKPGLARLASFKTIMVEPRCAVSRLE
ncbi:MAG TPA: NFACT RNA binding domain-containing protein, partial [Blastocatellia bacterium]|nr:NFACT RNA binding domain-containing protein [Blastocatellia bacterium]